MEHKGTSLLWLHEDEKRFRSAIAYTAVQTGFSERLIEKDYYCSLMLAFLFERERNLVFKGGTCLAKVQAGFYRMSEDLDFCIPMPCDTSQGTRRSQMKGLKKAINDDLPHDLPVFRVRQPMTGSNMSRHYMAEIQYTSARNGEQETIKLEVGLREPLLTAPRTASAGTILLDPTRLEADTTSCIAPVPVTCLSLDECYAEKFRAALSRREPAIRDFFDIDFAIRKLKLPTESMNFVDLVRKKMSMRGNEPADVSPERLAMLRSQVRSHLKPVLRDRDFKEFDLERAFAAVSEMAELIATNRNG